MNSSADPLRLRKARHMAGFTARKGQYRAPASDLDVKNHGGHAERALVIAHDSSAQRDLAALVTGLGYEVATAEPGGGAQRALEENRFAFTLLDLKVEGPEGTQCLRSLREHSSEAGPVVVVSRDGATGGVGDAAALGAVDSVREPVTRAGLECALRNALLQPRRGRGSVVEDHRARLEDELALWRSPRMQEIRNIIELIAGPDITVLICGETGTGKDVVARSIHYLS